ncbi:TadE/TadG family type IV pilus assembly protein [Fretibacter rubidus]|uniref:TadE/TadG family type IV pilus assembly protein n=1 Tax=Fretibacter rubidus TaxID=570162 RepID=UPI00352B981E
MLKLAHYIRAKARQYRKKEDGATAVEFAILIIPFCMLLFSVLELGIVFFLGASLNYALSETARDVRTGVFQKSCGTPANFKTEVCNKMSGGSKCTTRMRIDVKTSGSGRFEPDMLADLPVEKKPGDPGYDADVEPPIAADDYDVTAGRAPVIVRAQYHYKLTLPSALTRLNTTTGNVRVIEAITAFRNEPFPSGC